MIPNKYKSSYENIMNSYIPANQTIQKKWINTTNVQLTKTES